jgi:hypothetical protein
VWWVHDIDGRVLGSAYKVSWRDPDNVLGWMAAPERANKDYGTARTMAGAVAWLYAPESRQRRYAGDRFRSWSRVDVGVKPYVVRLRNGREIPIPCHWQVTVDGRTRGVINQVDSDPGMWWVNPGITRCGWGSPLGDGVQRFTSFEHAVRWATQLCDLIGCRDCFKAGEFWSEVKGDGCDPAHVPPRRTGVRHAMQGVRCQVPLQGLEGMREVLDTTDAGEAVIEELNADVCVGADGVGHPEHDWDLSPIGECPRCGAELSGWEEDDEGE